MVICEQTKAPKKHIFSVALQVSLNFQSSLESLHWNFQSSPASLHWKFQSNLQPPLKVWLKVCNKLSINFQGSNPKIKKNLVVFLKKIVFIFLKTMFFVSNKCVFYFKKCFFYKNRFHACYCSKKNLSKQHTKGSRNQIGCAKYTVGRNRKYVFLVPWFAHK